MGEVSGETCDVSYDGSISEREGGCGASWGPRKVSEVLGAIGHNMSGKVGRFGTFGTACPPCIRYLLLSF